MSILLPKESVLAAMRSGIPDAEWLLRQIESQEGWFRFPQSLSEAIRNLKIHNYPLLYESELAIVMMMLRGFLDEAGIKELLNEFEAATLAERADFIQEVIGEFDSLSASALIPKTEAERLAARERFEAMTSEEQQETIKLSQHIYSSFLATFNQYLSMMVHGEKLTSLVAQAKAGNTASNNSNCEQIRFIPLRWGVDSLYLSYPGMLADSVTRKLETLKKTAQSEHESEQARAQYVVDEHVFEVKDKGSGIFPFILRDNAFRISLSRPKSGTLPMAYVQVSSAMLSAFSPQRAEAMLSDVLLKMGDIESARTSRIDLYVDFTCDVDMESWSRHAWVTRAHNVQSYSCLGQFSGWSIGMGGVMAARLYNKSLEIQTSGKEYLKELWLKAGWDGVRPIWRLEFEFKRELLTQKGLSTLHETLRHLGGLWAYATDEWLRLTLPSEEDSTRSRWPVHPMWACLASIDWGEDGGPLMERFSSVSAPSEKQILSRLLSSMTTLMALNGHVGLDVAWDGLRLRLDNHLHSLCLWEGIHPNQYVEEKVRIKARRFNSILNQVDETPDIDEEARLYLRQSRGG